MEKYTAMNDDLYHYYQAHSHLPHGILPEVAELTSRRSDAIMQINRNQGSFMNLFIKAIGARTIVEVGTFTGYSAIAMASALPKDGRLYAFDINPETAAIARDFFQRASLQDRIDLRVGDARRDLDALVTELGAGTVDLAFIDADKTGYETYYEICLRLVRPGGILLLDNAIFGGSVTSPTAGGENGAAMRAINEKIARDTRVEACLMPVADGLYMARKK